MNGTLRQAFELGSFFFFFAEELPFRGKRRWWLVGNGVAPVLPPASGNTLEPSENDVEGAVSKESEAVTR